MVPVGGAIVASPNPAVISEIAKLYPGRASISPILDLFVTLLAMGEDGLTFLWKERQRLLSLMTDKLRIFADAHGEYCIPSPRNRISIGVTLETLCAASSSGEKDSRNVSFLGSMLFQRNVSGCRVVPKSNAVTTINGIDFIGWGAHTSDYPVTYFTAACSIGLTEDEITLFLDRLDKVWSKYEKSIVPRSVIVDEKVNGEEKKSFDVITTEKKVIV